MREMIEIGEVIESKTFHQLGILVLDGSGSMDAIGDGNISLADNVNRAVREFLGFFKGSQIANNFSIAVVTFDNNSRIHTPVTELVDIDDFADYNPMNGHGGTTFIGGALELAEQISNNFLASPHANSIPHNVSLIVMSDGLCLAPEETIKVADRIKRNDKMTIWSTLFTDRTKIGDSETKEAKSILMEIATNRELL